MIAILGGGITALSAAVELKSKGKEFILLEASAHCGGKIQSKIEGDFVLEKGPNTVLINNPETEDFLKKLELWDQLIYAHPEVIKKRAVLKNGRIEEIPSSIGSAFRSNLFGFNTLLSILSEPFKKSKTDGQEESLADFSRRRFNNQIYEDLITPFVSGIYAGDPERMSVDHSLAILKEAELKGGSVLRGMPKILKERKISRKGWQPPKQKIFSFKKGLSQMITTAENYLEGHIQYSSKIERIEKGQSAFHIHYRQGEKSKELRAEKVISTLPSIELAKTSFAQELNTALNKINYVPAIVTHLSYSKENFLQGPRFGILSRSSENVPFLGVLFNSHFFPHQSPEGSILLTVISGGYRNPEMMSQTKEEIVESICGSLKELGIVKGEPELRNVLKWEKAIPQYELGYGEILNSIDHFQKENPDFLLGGNYLKGISVSDCIAKGANLAAEID